MREMLNKILVEYASAKKADYKNNKLANYIRSESGRFLSTSNNIDSSQYRVVGSPGKGNWADIPWIAIFDKDITQTATKGYDIVYLFCSDMSGVYISLNQGWTYFKNKYGVKQGKIKINQVASAWKAILSSTLKDFSYDPIDLKSSNSNSDLAKGYELGHICGKFYDTNSIPDKSELIRDLNNMLGVYRELKGHLKDLSIEKTNDYLLANVDLGFLKTDMAHDELDGIETNIENFKQSSLVQQGVPVTFVAKPEATKRFVSRKTDFISKAKNQKKLGFAGELMVMNYEIEILIKAGKEKLARQVRHVSEDDGDGAGYDILSYCTDGTIKYIEVKTTTGDINSSFNVTDNELEFSKLNSQNYYLYRIFDYDKVTNTGKFYFIQGDIGNALVLRAQNYVVEGLL